jgi:hypothetical protein
MDEFRTIAKLWPAGTEVDLGTDSNVLGGPASFTRNAANFVTSADGANTYQFLFWNTGRHLTNKRQVRWNFTVLGWGTWTATRWYGTPGANGGGGAARARVDAFTIGGDQPLGPGTAIDGAASTYAAGAWPSGGDDHVISTVGGPAGIVAKDPFNSYDFAGWLQYAFGGDPVGEFVESDAGSGGTIGGAGFYDHFSGVVFPVAQGASADLLATYGHFNPPGGGGLGGIIDRFREIVDLFRHIDVDIPTKGDPGPGDLLRVAVLEELVRQSRPEGSVGTDYQALIRAAPSMSPDELKRALQSVKTSIGLGKTAEAAIEAQIKKGGSK